jgi:hypothetical protein
MLLAASAGAQSCGGGMSQIFVVAGKDGSLQVYMPMRKPVSVTEERAVTEFQEVTKEVTKVVNGKTVVQQVVEKVPVTRTIATVSTKWVCEVAQHAVALDKVKAFETDGKPIAAAALRARLAKPTLVVWTPDGKMPPANIAAVFKPGTLILGTESQPPAAVHGPLTPAALPPAGVIEGSAPAILPVEPPQPRPLPAPAPRPVQGVPQPKAAPSVFRPASFQQPVAEPVDREQPQPARIAAPAIGKIDPALPKLPDGLPPELLTAVLSPEGAVNIAQRMAFEHEISALHTRQGKDMHGEQVPVSLKQKHETIITTSYPPEYVSAKAVDGRPLTTENLKKYFKVERTVAVSVDGKPVDPFWLQNMKPLTVVLVLPEMMPMGPPNITAPTDAPPPPAPAGEAPAVALPPAQPVRAPAPAPARILP